ncbi:hypothetical protein KUTeg_013960 [Tegillarca granosa]|uniref:Protein O-mannosyl-transferase 2 n=1 Tax=Tegillarca granosa TaxID=220873 RepID=A0ABQ9EYS4_TEGGR|nr:hypothetical protein KUTeg_013960 [Tegillarca granosa]
MRAHWKMPSNIPTKIKQKYPEEKNRENDGKLSPNIPPPKISSEKTILNKHEKEVDRNSSDDSDMSLTKVKEEVQLEKEREDAFTSSSRTYYTLLVLMTMIALALRLHNIEIPSHVCWDETHFGKMGSWYIKRTFFFDVHPPLGKMLIGLSGYLTGYDGEFPFGKPGDQYGDTKYVGMRVFCALLGAALVPLSYMSTWLLTKTIMSAFFASLFVLLDVGTLTLSRHILLDPILMFFIMAATYCKLKFLSYQNKVKFVGLFIILLIGFTTVSDLWRLLGDPRQSMVTTYSHKDDNNYWILNYPHNLADPNDEPQIVKSGDLVRLQHYTSKRNLHSHKEPAPLTKRHYQLSGYGENGNGDANDIWIVQIDGAPVGVPVQTAKSKLRFIHYHVRCAVSSHDKRLPAWGFEQLEASCNPNLRDSNTLWNVEEVEDERLPNANFELYSPSFMEKFIESHSVMTQGNSGLKPKEGEITSRPWQWPLNIRGQIFSGGEHRIYLLGNPVIFWLALGLMALFLVQYCVFAVKVQRRLNEAKVWREHKRRIFSACWWLLLGWALHYLPFWPMTRVLYFHHYFPAFLFSAMISGKLSVISGYCFYLFYPMTYGMSGPLASQESGMMHKVKWLEHWDL